MQRSTVCAVLLAAQGAVCAQVKPALVGRYQLDVPGGDVLELRADGSVTMAGDGTRWSVQGNQLTVGPDVMNFVLQPNRLLLNVGGTLPVWKKLGAVAPLTPLQAAAAQAAHKPGGAVARPASCCRAAPGVRSPTTRSEAPRRRSVSCSDPTASYSSTVAP